MLKLILSRSKYRGGREIGAKSTGNSPASGIPVKKTRTTSVTIPSIIREAPQSSAPPSAMIAGMKR